MSDIAQAVESVKGKGHSGAALIAKQVLGSPTIFFMGKLLATPEVQALKTAEDPTHRLIFELLDIMTYRTYTDYVPLSAKFQGIATPAVEAKLKRLSILTLASRQRRLTYTEIQQAVGVADVRDAEDLVIDLITADLLKAKLDQQAGVVDVFDVASRDVSPEQIPALIQILEAWKQRCNETVNSLTNVGDMCTKKAEMKVAYANELAQKKERVRDECKRQLLEQRNLDEWDEAIKHGGVSAMIGRPKRSAGSAGMGGHGGGMASIGGHGGFK